MISVKTVSPYKMAFRNFHKTDWTESREALEGKNNNYFFKNLIISMYAIS